MDIPLPRTFTLLDNSEEDMNDEADAFLASILPHDATARDVSQISGIIQRLIDTSSDISSIEQMKIYLQSIRTLIFKLDGDRLSWGEPQKMKNNKCFFLGNTPDSGFFHTISSGSGCKTDDVRYNQKKKNITTFLKDAIVYMFQCIALHDKEILRDTNPFIYVLSDTIRYYCYFISSKTKSGLYDIYIKPLVEEINAVFQPILGSDLVLYKCESITTLENSGINNYGCGREVYVMPRFSKTDEDTDNKRIIIASTDQSGTGEVFSVKRETVTGGTRRHVSKYRRKTRFRRSKYLRK